MARAGLTVLEVEVIGGLGRPQAHGVDDVVAIARHWRVVGHGQHHLQGRRAWCQELGICHMSRGALRAGIPAFVPVLCQFPALGSRADSG